MTVSRTVSTGRSSRITSSPVASARALTSGSSTGIGQYSQCSGKRIQGHPGGRALGAPPGRPMGCERSVNDLDRGGAAVGGVAQGVAGSGDSSHDADKRGAGCPAVAVAEQATLYAQA